MKNKLSILFLLACIIFLIWPSIQPGLFQVYDNVQVTRISAMADELRSGQFPVRYLGEFGHGAGYFLFHYYSPLVYYLGSIFVILGFSAIQAVKLIYILLILTGASGMYFLLKSQFRLKAVACLGAGFFLLSPYLYHDLYHRGALAETAAFVLIPWILWSFLSLKKGRRYIYLAGLTLALSILSHVLTAGMTMVFLGLYFLIKLDREVFGRFVLATLLAFSISAFYFFPSLLDTKLVSYQNNPFVATGYLDHPVPLLSQLGLAKDSAKTSFLGFGLILALIAIFALVVSKRVRLNSHQALAISIVVVSGLLLWLMSPSSAWLWERVVYLRYIQFPFRFLTIATPLAILAWATVISTLPEKNMLKLILSLALLLTPLATIKHYEVLGYQYGTEYRVEDPCQTTAWADEHLPNAVSQCLTKKPRSYQVVAGDLEVVEYEESNLGRDIRISSSGSGSLLISRYHFPFWVATDESGQDIPLTAFGVHGLIKLELEDSSQVTYLTLKDPPLVVISNIVSLITIIGATTLAVCQFRRKKAILNL